MAQCPTPHSPPETLPIHGRRKYCAKCRASMARYEKLKPNEILDRNQRYTRTLFRIEHRRERGIDQQQALSQLRRDKRRAKR
jgi:hypothetical protein